MSDKPLLRYVNPQDVEFDSIPMEKRRAPRYRSNGRVTAVAVEGTGDNRHNRIFSVELINMSETGAGALSQEKLAVNSSLTLFIPPHGAESGYDLTGRIVRCVRRDNCYEIGLQVNQRIAA